MRFVLVALLALPSLALAVPTTVSHQGRLFDALGSPLTGSHDLHISLYDTETGGTAAWTETITTSFDDGYFHVVLGETTGLDSTLFDGGRMYVAMAVDTGPEMATRLPTDSVPYAITASSVSGGVVDASEVRIGGTTIIDSDGLIPYSQLSGLPTDNDTLGGLTCDDGDVAMQTSGSWACAAPADLDLGTVSIDALPVGGSAGTVAAGDHGHTDNIDFGRLPVGTSVGTIAEGNHTHSDAVDFARLPVGTSDTTVAQGDHSHDTLADVAVDTLDSAGPVCAGTMCTYHFKRRSPNSDWPTCSNPPRIFTVGTFSGTNSGTTTTVTIEATGNHRGIANSAYWCHRKYVITAGDALWLNTPVSSGAENNCGRPGDAGGWSNVSHPNYTGGDIEYFIDLNCGARTSVDFTLQYDPRYFTPDPSL